MSSTSWLQHCRGSSVIGARIQPNPLNKKYQQKMAAATGSSCRATRSASAADTHRQFSTEPTDVCRLATVNISGNQHHQHHQHRQSSWNAKFGYGWTAGAAAASSLLCMDIISKYTSLQHQQTHCEEKASEEKEENSDKKHDFEIGPDDPYYEVPEEDEPTDCQMCLTFRQGPCRLEWKRFELCAKDKSPALNSKDKEGDDGRDEKKDDEKKEDSDALACMKYAMPFYECSSKYVNTYVILGNELTFQKIIQPLHDAFSSDEAQSRRLCWVRDPEIDWSGWEYFVSKLEELGGGVPTKFRLEKTGFNSPAEALKASWNDKDGQQYLMMDNENEPYLINVTASVPKKVGNDQTLMMTYALDQYGNLLGDKRYDEEDEAKEQSEKKESGEEPRSLSPNTNMSIQLIPGMTESFTIYGLYVPSDDNEADLLREGKLYESRPYTVTASSTKEATEEKKETKKEEKENTQKDAEN